MKSDLEMELWKVEWYSPLYVEKYLMRTSKTVDKSVIEAGTQYQKTREIRLGRAMALCLYAMTGEWCFVTLPSREPPDLCILAKDTKKNTIPTVYKVEATTYIGNPKENLLEHLKKTGKITGKQQMDETDTILVNIGIGLEPGYQPLIDYLNSINAKYRVWALQDVSREGTTYALFTKIFPIFEQVEINLGLAGIQFQKECPMERVKLNQTGKTKSGTVTKMENVIETNPWSNY